MTTILIPEKYPYIEETITKGFGGSISNNLFSLKIDVKLQKVITIFLQLHDYVTVRSIYCGMFWELK